MSSIDSSPPSERTAVFSWQRSVFDSLLAFISIMAMTGLLFALQLYPRIPNISIAYLLVVLPLATSRGRYCATFAAFVAFFAFDYFLVPPIYQFTVAQPEEWIALFVFLLSALLTGNLAAALRRRAEEAACRERETQALYQLVRVTNNKATPEEQLQAISRKIVEVFFSWGVQDCELRQANTTGNWQVQANTSQTLALSPDEQVAASALATQGRGVTINEPVASPSLVSTDQHSRKRRRPEKGEQTHSLHFLPLKQGEQVVGELHLWVRGDPRALLQEEYQPEAHRASSFFWTYLSQVTTLLERAQLQKENLRLAVVQRTDALRAALLSSVSHDLRTPLTSIKASASSLLQEEVLWDEETRRGFLESIEQEADRLNRLVANLLDMSRIEEGALKPDKDWYSVKALIQDVVGRMALLLEERQVLLHLPDDLLLAELDYLMIDQVLTNLIENALHYTPATSPLEIRAQMEREQVVVRVADRGPGLPLAQLERVFDKFYRVLHKQPSDGYPHGSGSGLGLAVCRGLVEAHGGRIWAEPREGGGLIICVVLPVGGAERSVV